MDFLHKIIQPVQKSVQIAFTMEEAIQWVD